MFTSNNKTVLFIDLDGTIIEKVAGQVFPQFIGDFKYKGGILPTLKNFVFQNHTRFIFIVTNQIGIEQGGIREDSFVIKIKFIAESIKDYLWQNNYQDIEVNFRYCKYIQDERNKKPSTGMLSDCLKSFETENIIPKEDMLMVGDFDTDEKTAQNFGIDYMDVNLFINFWCINYRKT